MPAASAALPRRPSPPRQVAYSSHPAITNSRPQTRGRTFDNDRHREMRIYSRRAAAFGAKQTFDETPRARRFSAPWLPAACCAARAFNRCAHTVPSGHRLRAGLFLIDLSILFFWSTVFAAGNDRPAVRTRSHLERFFRIREGGVVAEYLLNPPVVVADVQRLRSSTTSTPQ